MNKFMIIIGILCFIKPLNARAIGSDGIFYIDGDEKYYVSSGNIYKKDSSGRGIVTYEGQKDYIDSYLSCISPNDKYLAIVEQAEGVVPPGKHNYEILPRNNLVICDIDGNVLYSIDDDVRKLSWNPDGTKIAYITGTYYEGGRGFRPNGIYILDLIDGSKKPITKDFPHSTGRGGVGGGYALNWAVHDGNIYVMESDSRGGNYMYDTRSGTTQSVPYKGIHFSPDGKYYLAIIPEDDNYLYESATNRDITAEVKAAIGGMPYSWILDRDHHLYGGKTTYVTPPSSGADSEQQIVRAYAKGERKIKEKRVLIYDVDKRQIVEEWVEKP